jgi:gliding motility-associated-like protein
VIKEKRNKFWLKTWLIVVTILLSQDAISQNETKIWYFGQNAGLDFNSGSPIALTDGQLSTNEGCATIADNSGSLLFYTDGITVWNKNHAVMSNGTGLMGNPSTTQAATIVPMPSSSNLYYIFTLDSYGGANGFRYSIVDMSLDSGNGAITSKNVLIYTPSCEKLAIVKHANTSDYWVVTHGWGNATFYSYLLTSSGLSATSIESNIGINVSTFDTDEAIGYMRISPDGSKLALCYYFSSVLQLFDFNQNTGELSNEITIYTGETGSNLYGLEFSPNSKVLYFTKELLTTKIYQCNLEASDIPSTVLPVYSNSNPLVSALQLGPDNKIYIGQNGSTKLGVINQPNLIGTSCNIEVNAIDLAGKYCLRGLPPFISSFFNVGFYTSNVCVGNSASFTLNAQSAPTSVLWDFGDGNTSSTTNPNHVYTSAGTYIVSVTATGSTGTATNSRDITIYPLPTLLTSTATLKQCDDDSDGFSVFNLQESTSLLVSNATGFTFTYFETDAEAQSNTNPITNPTSYTNEMVTNDIVFVRVQNSNGCFQVAQLNLIVSTTLIPASFQYVITSCDDAASGSITDGISNNFDFTDATAAITALYPAGQSLTIKYYTSLNDAVTEVNAITNTTNYSNVGYPDTQSIFVRVDNQLDNDCLGLGQHITLNVERIPVVQPLVINSCDDDQDGVNQFDTTNLEANLLNGLTNVSVSYTDSSGIPIVMTNPYLTTSQTINATVSNTFGEQCDFTTTIQFIVDDLPEAFPIDATLTTTCDDEADPTLQNGIYPFDTSTFQSTILGSQTGMIVKYYDAFGNLLSTPLPNPFLSASQTLLVEVSNSVNSNCIATNTIPLVVNERPKINLSGSELVCSNNPSFTKIINAGLSNPSEIGNYSYTWYLNGTILAGENHYTLTVNTAGTYSVDVENANGCVTARTIIVTSSNTATIDSVEINDLVNNNSILILVSGDGNYTYSMDGQNYQNNNFFDNLLPGIYTVYVNDELGCGFTTQEISVLGIPKFFTPNNDGTNDYWNINGVSQQFNANATIRIYDRFGKLLKQIKPLSVGWDGTYNGYTVLSDDYWYVIELENGRTVKGHFTLKR